jgi:nitrogen fixation/metabolism regulation signal transduction histidine kinase
MPLRLRPVPLAARLLGCALLAAAVAAAGTALLVRWLPPWAAGLIAGLLAATLGAALIWRSIAPVGGLFRALAGTVASYRDGDFSFGIAWERDSELIELVRAHNALGDTLREQRQALVQRELLLDTLVQNTPVAMVLTDGSDRVVLGNLAARKLLGDGRRLEGQALATLVANTPQAMQDAFARGGDGLFSVGDEDNEDIFHLSRRSFRLNGRRHELVLLRQLTAELRRQEVQTWKKVIRVISHELNNSLAPIASLAHSSAELLRRGQLERLPTALATIEERARHLEGFIRDYARFAKLPAPRLVPLEWARFLAQLRSQVEFAWSGQCGEGVVHADPAQLEQAMLNLIKNAHESGSPPDQVQLVLRRVGDSWRIDILDRGCGMSEAVLAQALLPFYSTKRHGTGLGLALCRDIIEAHCGRIALQNREGGGLAVSLTLPVR